MHTSLILCLGYVRVLLRCVDRCEIDSIDHNIRCQWLSVLIYALIQSRVYDQLVWLGTTFPFPSSFDFSSLLRWKNADFLFCFSIRLNMFFTVYFALCVANQGTLYRQASKVHQNVKSIKSFRYARSKYPTFLLRWLLALSSLFGTEQTLPYCFTWHICGLLILCSTIGVILHIF